jgi:hypothetical protein
LELSKVPRILYETFRESTEVSLDSWKLYEIFRRPLEL